MVYYKNMQHDLYKTWVEIDAKALRHNMAMFKKHMESGTQLIAIIKANAYGHGLAEVTSILKKEKNIWLGVDSIDEALLVKTSRAKQLIIILGFIPESRLAEALQENFHISIYSVETLEYIKNILKKSPRIKAHLHLKIETGTNRLGIQLHDLINIKTFPSIEGVYTHFADAENPK